MSNRYSNYPPCPNGVYSLRRLCTQAIAPAKGQISVGGRVHCNNGANPQLIDAGGRLELPPDFCQKTGARSFETWVITFSASDFENQTGCGRVLQVIEAVRLTAPLRELNWALAEPAEVLAWGPFVESIKVHLKRRGLQEVATPSLVVNPGMEPELEPFAVEIEGRVGRTARLFLPTSPELHLKQLLALGYTDIFEIKAVFRKDELTAIHEPEFHMLEWYRGYADLEMICDDLADLLSNVAKIDIRSIRRTTVRELFEATGFQLQPDTQADELRQLAMRLGLHPNVAMDWNDLFHLIWVAKVEPNLPSEPLFVRDYPPTQAALARLNQAGWADRLEFYWHGIEIANAFHELNDPVLQRERFVHDQKKRIEYGRTPLAIDENFMASLEFGLPPSGGIALGVDRLFMLATGKKNLKDVRAFAFNHQFR